MDFYLILLKEKNTNACICTNVWFILCESKGCNLGKDQHCLVALAERCLLAIFTSASFAFMIFGFDQIMLLSKCTSCRTHAFPN